jgi:chromosome segregation ATPase
MNHEEYETRRIDITKELQPLREEIEKIHREEKDEIKRHLLDINAKMSSLVVQYTGLAKDVNYISIGMAANRKDIDINKRYIYMACGALALLSFAIANIMRFIPTGG